MPTDASQASTHLTIGVNQRVTIRDSRKLCVTEGISSRTVFLSELFAKLQDDVDFLLVPGAPLATCHRPVSSCCAVCLTKLMSTERKVSFMFLF